MPRTVIKQFSNQIQLPHSGAEDISSAGEKAASSHGVNTETVEKCSRSTCESGSLAILQSWLVALFVVPMQKGDKNVISYMVTKLDPSYSPAEPPVVDYRADLRTGTE